jgi:hypothetical protein
MTIRGPKHPVIIKKIKINLWKMTDEIEALIQEEMQESSSALVDMSKIVARYQSDSSSNTEENLAELIPLSTPDPSIDTGEDDMMKAMMGGGDEEEASSDTSSSETSEEEVNDSDNVIALGAQDHGPKVTFIRPILNKSKQVKGSAFLSEITMENIFCFTTQSFLEGQSVVIELQVPRSFMLTAEVVYSFNFGKNSRVISEERANFRVGLKLLFLRPGERTLLREFLTSIEPSYDEKHQPLSQGSSKSSGGDNDGIPSPPDDAEEVDDLDL